MFYLLLICSCLIACSEIPFSESLCLIGTSQFISPIHDLTCFFLMWVFGELDLRTHLTTIFVLCVPFYKPAFAMIYLTAIRIKRVSIYLFLMQVSLAQWFGKIGTFYNNTLAFSKISVFYITFTSIWVYIL